MNVKKYFNKLSDSTKGKIGIVVILLFLSLVDWVIHPPFFKDQKISIVYIEHIKRNNFFHQPRWACDRFYYTYNTANGENIEGSFELYTYPMPSLNDTVVRNVRTPYSDGGELRILSGAFIIFLVAMAIFIIAFIFWQILKYIGLKNISESSSNAILFAIFVIGLFIFVYI